MRRKKQLILSKDLFSTRIFLIIAVLILLSIACNVPLMASQSNQEKPPGFVETSVAQTLIAFDGSQGQNGNGQSDQGDSEADVTDTPDITDTPTLTPTVTDTPTPQVAMIYASANTNCRTGQGVDFPWLVSMQAGDDSEAVGVDPTGEYPYWYIRRPDQPSEFCWLWGKYATPSGPYQSLPVYTPVPTPTPGMQFSLSYHSLETCAGQWGLVYQVVNTGAITLESWRTTATDHTGGSNPQDFQLDQFNDYSGCIAVNQQNDLTAGEGQHVLMIFDNNPVGHDITTKVKICSEDGLAGVCISRTIRHTP
ncbi:MAG: hypothetical protein ACC633_09750 [Anaerolineales bacterium]